MNPVRNFMPSDKFNLKIAAIITYIINKKLLDF